MKVLITTDWYEPVINGVVTSVLTLKRELTNRGHEVRVATLNDSSHSYKKDDVYYMRSVDMGRIYPGARAVCFPSSSLYEEIIEWKPNVIHSQCEFSSFLIARKISNELWIPVIHTYHTVYEDYTHYFGAGKPWGRQAAVWFSRFILSRTDFVIAPSTKVKKLLEAYGVERPIAVIPTGIRLERFLPISWQQVDEDRKIIREKYGIGDGQKVLLILGRLAKEKNIEEIITYFGAMNRDDMELLIVGNGPYRKELEELADLQENSSHIHFTGMIAPEETTAYYRAGDFFVSASQSETQGITYLEALSSGLPVICRKDSCVEGIVKAGENGFQYETYEEFREECIKIIVDTAWRNFLSAGAVRTGQKFGAEQFGEKVCAVYAAALAGRRSHRKICMKRAAVSCMKMKLLAYNMTEVLINHTVIK